MKSKRTFNPKKLMKLIIPSICLAVSIIMLVIDLKPMGLVVVSMIPFTFVTGSVWRIVKDIQTGRIELKIAAGSSKLAYLLAFLGIRTLFNILSAFAIFLSWGIIHNQFANAIYMYLLVIALFMLGIGFTFKGALYTNSVGTTVSLALLSSLAGYWIVVGLYNVHATEKGIWFLIAMVLAIIVLSFIFIIWAFRTKWARWNERTIQEDSDPSPTQIVFQRIQEKIQDFLENLE